MRPAPLARRRSSRDRAPPPSPSGVFTDDLAFVENEDPVGEREDLVELERDQEDRTTFRALLDEPAVHELDCSHVEAPRGLSRDRAPSGRDRSRGRESPSAGCRPRARRRASRDSPPRTSNSLISLRARAISARGFSQPSRESGSVRNSCSATFSAIENSSTRPWRCRSCGIWPNPSSKCFRTDSCVTSRPASSTPPDSGLINPASASISSVCPFPSTPAIPTISPA